MKKFLSYVPSKTSKASSDTFKWLGLEGSCQISISLEQFLAKQGHTRTKRNEHRALKRSHCQHAGSTVAGWRWSLCWALMPSPSFPPEISKNFSLRNCLVHVCCPLLPNHALKQCFCLYFPVYSQASGKQNTIPLKQVDLYACKFLFLHEGGTNSS